ncbi:MAG: tetratricopeptide repeat protein [Bryobacterales bacterium]|nr:tetratricopeptide repeat protein [Bryobacterales bacterium]
MRPDSRDQFNAVLDGAESGVAKAQFSVGRFYKNGFGVDKDPFEAADWWLRAAQQGHPEAERELRVLLREELQFQVDGPAARWWYAVELADAREGDAKAQSIVGEMFWRGFGTGQDASAAVEWWRKAAEQGDRTAQLELRRRRAEKGDVDEQFALGTEILEGAYESADKTEGLHWLGEAAACGHVEAMFELGKLRLSGPSGIRESKQGAHLLLAAAQAGHDPAVLQIGQLYSHIEPLVPASDVDGDEAIRWLRKAAEMGQGEAQYRMGRLYLLGLAVPQDSTQAHAWMLKAADAGHDDAQYILSCMYQVGHGVPMDEDEARRWLELAAKQGNGDAMRKWWLGAPLDGDLPWE